MDHTIKSGIAAAFLSTLSFGACAAIATSSVDYSNVQFRVIDLTPADGAAAGITFTGGTSSITFWAQDAGVGQVLNDITRFPTLVADPTSLTLSGKTFSASSTETSGGAIATIDARGTRQGTGLTKLSSSWEFELAPHTALLISGQMEATLARSIDDNRRLGGTASFYATGSISGNDGAGSKYLYEKGTYYGYTGTFQDNFALTLLNGGDSALAGHLYLHATTQVFTYLDAPAPVPEPATYAMLGAGLLVTGIAARRRRPV